MRGGASGITIQRSNWNRAGESRCIYDGEASVSRLSSIPDGYLHPYAWVLASIAGGVASRYEISGAGDIDSANLAGGLNAESTLSGAGDLVPPDAQLIVQALATLVAAGSLSADAVGTLNASATLVGQGQITAALGALADAVANIIGSGGVTGAATAIGHVSANITPFTELSPENLAASVWNALAASFNAAGSMGEAINSGGAGGLTPTQASQLLEMWKLMGLDVAHPLIVSATARSVDDVSQTIAEAAGTVTVTREP